jgi:hypothetical protein
MRKDLERKFQTRWPGWFDLDGSPMQTAMARGFAHGAGWFDLVWRLCEQIEPIVLAGEADTREWEAPLDTAKQPPFEVYQVKEKFGGLRFYCNSHSEAILTLVQRAQAQSFHTCDICGHRGILRKGSGWRTRCDEHIDAPGERY